MQAPGRATLYDVETAIEGAFKTRLEAIGVSPCFVQRELRDLPGSRVDIRLRLDSDYGRVENCWQGQIIFSNWTDRSVDADTLHGQRRGAIRSVCTRVPAGDEFHPDFGEDVLPYHLIRLLEMAGTTTQADVTDDLDVSEMPYTIIVSCRTDSFPPPADLPFSPADDLAFQPAEDLMFA